MAEAPNGSRMTSLDAAFYHLERTGQLLHVGGVYTVEGAIDFERLLTDLAARMHLIPRSTLRGLPSTSSPGAPRSRARPAAPATAYPAPPSRGCPRRSRQEKSASRPVSPLVPGLRP